MFAQGCTSISQIAGICDLLFENRFLKSLRTSPMTENEQNLDLTK